MRRLRHVPLVGGAQADTGHAGETVFQLAWERLRNPLEELEEVAREKEVWAFLLRRLQEPVFFLPVVTGFACRGSLKNSRVLLPKYDLVIINIF